MRRPCWGGGAMNANYEDGLYRYGDDDEDDDWFDDDDDEY